MHGAARERRIKRTLKCISRTLHERMEQRNLSVELAISKKRRMAAENMTNKSRMDATQGIRDFESTLQKMEATGGSANVQNQSSDDLPKLKIGTEPNKAYLSDLKERMAQHAMQKKAREIRRQRMLVEQQSQGREAGLRMQHDLFISTITREAKKEADLSQRLWQLKAEAEVMRKNREIRERQYSDCREKDRQETLRRELLIWRNHKEQRRREKAEKDKAFCRRVVCDVVKLSEWAAEYRENMNALVPKKEYRRLAEEFQIEVIDATPVAEEPEVSPEGTTQDPPEGTAAGTEDGGARGGQAGLQFEMAVDVGAMVDTVASKINTMGRASEGSEDGVASDSAKVYHGFVLDGFPQTLGQALLFERKMTGADPARDAAIRTAASRIAPPPAELLPDPKERPASGLDAVIVLCIDDDDVALRRALGRRIDRRSGTSYHMDDNPPPEDVPGTCDSLEEIEDKDAAGLQIHERITRYSEEVGELKKWLHDFKMLCLDIETTRPLDEVYCQARECILKLIQAKKAAEESGNRSRVAAESCNAAECARERAGEAMSAARSAAEGLLTTKQAELLAAEEAKKLSKDNAHPAELISSEASQKVAQLLVTCTDAASQAGAAADDAEQCCRDVVEALRQGEELAGQAEACAEANEKAQSYVATLMELKVKAIEEASKAKAAAAEAQTIVERAQKLALLDGVAAVEEGLSPHAPGDEAEGVDSGAVPNARHPNDWEPEVASAMSDEWKDLESSYLEELSLVLSSVRDQRSLCTAHFINLRKSFSEYLRRSDDRQQLATQFQDDFNSVDGDLRSREDVKAELMLRCEELRDAAWEVCDAKLHDSQAELQRIASSAFVEEQTKMIECLFIAMIQIEHDRLLRASKFMWASSTIQFALPPPIGFPVGYGDIKSESQPDQISSKLDAKKGMGFPGWAEDLASKHPQIGRSCKIALATVKASMEIMGLETCADSNPGKGGKKDKHAAEMSEKEIRTIEASREEMRKGVEAERDSFLLRLQQICARAEVHINEMIEANNNARDCCERWMKQLYKGECSSVLALVDIAMEAAAKGDIIHQKFAFKDEDLVIESNQRQEEDTREEIEPLCETEPALQAESILTYRQLEHLVAAFTDADPKEGYMRVPDVANLMLEVCSGGEAHNVSFWSGMDVKCLRKAMRDFDDNDSGYCDWRDVVTTLILSKFSNVLLSAPATFAEAAQVLKEHDGDGDGRLTREQWQRATLPFSRKSDYQAELGDGVDPRDAIKDLLWNLFAERLEGAQEKTVDACTPLLYLCTDGNEMLGIEKAFATIAGTVNLTENISAVQIHQAMYPMASKQEEPSRFCQYTVAEVQAMVRKVAAAHYHDPGTAESLTLDEVMLGNGAEDMARRLRQKYKLKDIFVETYK
eukprot:evm.model.scf_1208EXC.6 EVM.evm.TU.scf_1208EXC.6   scf_1208EXC:28213-40026(-)